MDQALKTYSVPMAIALVVMLLVQLVKSDKIPIDIPARARPWVAIGLALAAAIATRVIQGIDVGAAVIEGLGAGLTSIGIFEAGSSVKPGAPPAPPAPPSDRDAKTDPPAAPPADPPLASRVLWITDPFLFGGPVRVLFSIAFALLAFGCADAFAPAKVALTEASNIEVTSAKKLDDVCGRPMQLLALEPPGNDRTVRARALAAKCDKPEAAYKALRDQHILVLAMLDRAVDENDGDVTVGDLLDAVQKLTETAHELTLALEGLEP